jgi:carbon monoxide dehydrogenase subunit G
MKVEGSVDVEAPPEALYELVMDPERLGDWVSIHDRLVEAPGGELDKGSRLAQCLRVAGRRFTVRWRVTQDDRPRRVVWEGRGPFRTRARVTYDFTGRDGGGTHFSYGNEYELPGGAAGRLTGRAVSRIARREVDRSLDRLKELAEK